MQRGDVHGTGGTGGYMLTDAELAEIEQRCSAATYDLGDVDDIRLYGDGVLWSEESGAGNAAFIAHARQDVPALIAEVRFWRDAWRHIDACRACSEGDYCAIGREAKERLSG